MEKGSNKQPTVFILYIPGGAMLGLIPALTLSRLEALTETSTQELFQVIEGVSTGSILASGFNVPGRDAKTVAELFVQHGPQIFPDMPARWARLHARIGINVAKYIYNMDPKQSDYLSIRVIGQLCEKMKRKSDAVDHEMIDELKRQATQRWLTDKKQKSILQLGVDIVAQDENLEKYVNEIDDLVAARTFTSSLGKVFKAAAVGVMDGIKNRWAKLEDSLYSSEVPETIFKQLYGDRKISEGICSTYISAYDVINNRIVTFSALKDDLFSKDPNAPAKVQNDVKFWDATMASSANELAFKAHITETNILCSDKAPLHKPRSVSDVLAKVDPGTRVVLVIAGTGSYASKDLLTFLERRDADNETLSEEERYRQKLEIIRDHRAELGVVGNLAMGRELSELEGYTTSDAMDDFAEKLGKENIFNFTPRMAPHTPQEEEEFPGRDTLDASKENIKKIIKRGRKLSEDYDDELRELAQQLVDNLYLIGDMDQEKYERVSRRIGIRTMNTEADIERETKGIEERIVSNDNSKGLSRMWRNLTRRIFNDNKKQERIDDAKGTGTDGPAPDDKGPGGPNGPS